jgi:hypothetical protein
MTARWQTAGDEFSDVETAERRLVLGSGSVRVSSSGVALRATRRSKQDS